MPTLTEESRFRAAASTMKMTTITNPRKRSFSSAVAAVFVIAAAAIAWFSLSGSSPATHVPLALVTMAPAESPDSAGLVRRVSTSGLPTRIVVESASVDAPIAEVGTTVADGKATWETAWKAAGHHIDSSLPGQPGNMVITGHVSVADRSNLAVFKQLDRVSLGDIVEVYSGDRVFRYAVNKVIVVPPSAVKLLRSDTDSTVTLITCTHDLKNRLVVVATLQA